METLSDVLIVFFRFHSVRRLDFRLLGSNFIPIGGEHSATALLERLVHGSLRLFARVFVNGLKEILEGSFAFGFVGFDFLNSVRLYLVPTLFHFARRRIRRRSA